MNEKYVLLTEPELYSENELSQLKSAGIRPILSDCQTQNSLLEALNMHFNDGKKIIGLFVRIGLTIDDNVFKAAGEALKWIVTPTTGLEHIDLVAAKNNNAEVLSLKGQIDFLRGITPTAELVFGLLFVLTRQLTTAYQAVLSGCWERKPFLGYELKGMSIGILGLGRLGTMVSNYAKAFSMKVFAHDIRDEPFLDSVNLHVVKKHSIASLVAESDIVSLHLPLNEHTAGIIDDKCFNKFKRGSLLINTARGELIDEKALVSALKNEILAGCALDVLSGDSRWDSVIPENNPLLNYARNNNNIIITPHIGGFTYNATCKTRAYMIEQFLRNIKANDGETTNPGD